METLPAYALDLQKGDYMLSFDIESGYRHLRLHPSMRDMFLFHYDGKFYRCIVLPFGWGRWPLWFTRMMRPLLQHLSSELAYRVLVYLDDFLVGPRIADEVATVEDCRSARVRMHRVLDDLGLARHPTKGEWKGTTRVEHLGVVIDTVDCKFYIAPRKIEKVRRLARQLLSESSRGRR